MKRRPDLTRAVLLRAGATLLDRHYTSPEVTPPPLPISIKEMLEVVGEVARDGEPTSLSTGAVNTAFGGKGGYLEQLAEHYIGTEQLIGDLTDTVAQLLASDEPPANLRRRLAEADFRNMTKLEAPTRHYFLTHAYAAIPQMREHLHILYEAFDDLLGELYATLGQREGVQPVHGLHWHDVALSLTAWVEGQALRYLADTTVRDRPWLSDPVTGQPGIAATGADALWRGLTRPIN